MPSSPPDSVSEPRPHTATSRGRRPSSRPRPHPGRCRPLRIDAGAPAPGRHAPAHRPHCREPPLLLWQTQEARHEPSGPRRPVRSPGVALSALPGAVHAVRATREHGIINALAEVGITCWADKGYRGVGSTVRTPYWGRWEALSTGQQAVNRSHTRSAHWSSRPWPLSSPGGPSACSAARPPASQALSKPFSPSISPAQTDDGKGSLSMGAAADMPG